MKHNKNIFLIASLFLASILLSETVVAQDIYRRNYSGDLETFLQDQAAVIFDNASEVLAAYPPTPDPGIERKMALYSLDALLHDTRLDKGPSFMSYVHKMATNFLTELTDKKPTGSEVRVMKLYNYGYIIQSADITVGIDLVRGGIEREGLFYIDEELMRSIVEQCDIHFVTHHHSDHASQSVAQMFHEQGKTTIVPEQFWGVQTPGFRVLRGDEMIQEKIEVPAKKTSLDVWIYPGYQGDTKNNVYFITLPSGQTVMHHGDQTYYEDLVEKIKENSIKIDILLMGCAGNIFLVVPETKPSYVFIGHENEMEHGILNRESYWLSFRRSNGLKPVFVMAWGESYTIRD